ncbi:hypothetical protein HYV82_01365 [Candidatus Woesearchaeota archaeon]|nr:hypothetical protein [Candidatus Woesearchaeota archaeon]
MTRTITVPVKEANGELWLVLNRRGLFRAVRIDKRKKQVLDWDGHHCDEALADGSVRYCPRGLWDVIV